MPRVEELASPRIRAGVAGDIEVTYTADGTITDPSAATLGVVDEAGAVIVAAGTVATLPGAGTGKARYTLTAAMNALPAMYTATWALTVPTVGAVTLVTRHESRGELLYTERDARLYDGGALSSATTYPQDTLLQARDQVTEAFENILGRSLGSRYVRKVLDGDGSCELEVPAWDLREVRSVSERVAGAQAWTAYTAAQLADILVYPGGLLERETLGVFTYGHRNVALEFEAGMQPIPLELRQAGLRLTRMVLVRSDLDDRAFTEVNQFGTFQLSVAGGKGGAWFGIPSVDAALSRYRRKLPGIA